MTNDVRMSKKDVSHCTECGDKLKTKNERVETQDGIRYWRVDYWCVNEECSRYNQLGIFEKKLE